MLKNPLPEWELVLSSASHLQRILPDAVLVGGTASAVYASHRLSTDADHILNDLRYRFDHVLASLESVAGWKTARVQRPVQILGSLDGIETGIRQLIREEPLESSRVEVFGEKLLMPSQAEILRIKGVLILKRNATRDYLDFVALADYMGSEKVVDALRPFDRLYPQPNGESALQQLQVQLCTPLPYDLDDVMLSEYKNLDPRWHEWSAITSVSSDCALLIFDRIVGLDTSLAELWGASPAVGAQSGSIKAFSDSEVIQHVGQGRFVVWQIENLSGAAIEFGQIMEISANGVVQSVPQKSQNRVR